MSVDDDLSVLLCTDYLPPGGGGVEVVVENLARGLAKRGVDVGVFTLGTDDPTTLRSVSGVTVYRVPTVDLTGVVGLQTQVAPQAVRGFGAVLDEHDPDVVHLHNRFFFTSVVGALRTALTRRHVPLVTTFHLASIADIGGVSGLAASAYQSTVARGIVRSSTAVIAVSEAAADLAVELGSPPDRTRVVYNGVDSAEFAPGPAQKDGEVVLFVGRLVRNKGPGVFVDAMGDVLDGRPAATGVVVGTGPMEGSLRRRAAELGIEDRVEFRGFVDSVASVMRESEVFCRPSLSEGLPLTLLEAMATGLPPVVTPVGGVPEVVTDGENGVLVPVDDPKSLGSRVSALLESRERRDRMGAAAREYVVENHDWDSRTERVMTVYREVANE